MDVNRRSELWQVGSFPNLLDKTRGRCPVELPSSDRMKRHAASALLG